MRRKNALWLVMGLTLIGSVLIAFWRRPINAAHAAPVPAEAQTNIAGGIRVTTIKPLAGGITRKTIQPCAAHWHESAGLFAKVSGYLKVQDVDIGARVKQGQVLAVIDMPELDREVDLMAASRAQAIAEVKQMEGRKKTTAAEYRAAQAACIRAEADVQRWAAEHVFREKEYQRFLQLNKSESVQLAIVEEKHLQSQSAEAAKRSAESAVHAAKEQVLAAEARTELAELDVTVAQAKAGVAEAHLAKATQMASYAKVVAPFDGIVTQRSFHRGDFVRSADHGGDRPLLRVARTDLVRVVVHIPDRDVPFAHPGDTVKIDFDALPGREFTGQLGRIAFAEDAQSRTMRAEVDLKNPDMRIVDQMYGRMEIILEKASEALRIPSGCLIGDVRDGKGQVFVVRDKVATLQPVSVATDSGSEIEVVSGLSLTDEVVIRAPAGLSNGTPVTTGN